MEKRKTENEKCNRVATAKIVPTKLTTCVIVFVCCYSSFGIILYLFVEIGAAFVNHHL